MSVASLGKKAVVIGAGSGMGRAAALRLHQDGYSLTLVDLKADAMKDFAGTLNARAISVDVTRDSDVESLVAAYGDGVDALVHSAGLSMSMAPFERIMSVNLGGTARVLKKFAPVMNQGGAGVCFASIAGHLAGNVGAELEKALLDDSGTLDRIKALLPTEQQVPGMAYALSKLGVLRLVERAAAEWGHHGARICSVSPGLIDTPMGALERKSNPEADSAIRVAPIPRLGTPEDIANVVAFLCSSQAAFVTGCDIIVDGGWVGSLRTGGEDSPIAQSMASGRRKS